MLHHFDNAFTLNYRADNKGFLKNKKDFKEFFNLYYPSLRLFAAGIVNDFSVAEDFVQDAFIKLWQNALTIENEPTARSYLYKTVKNLCINHLEHSNVVHKHEEATVHEYENTMAINNSIIEEETHRLIYKAINELPAQCRNILLLSINGLKNNEIAEELNITVNTVKTQKKIAYKQLKIKLKDIYFLVGLMLINL